MEHFPVPYRWFSRVIQMCIRTRLGKLMIHIFGRRKGSSISKCCMNYVISKAILVFIH